ncbi:MAG: glycosyltransferase family 2 protein [Paracoccaceae bacterium]
MPSKPDFLYECLASQSFGDVILLGALANPGQNGRDVQLYFKSNTPQELIEPAKGFEISDRRSIGDGPWLRGKVETNTGPIPMTIAGNAAQIEPNTPELHLFEDLNVGLAVRNLEPVEAVLQWLEFHVRTQGMNGAIIVNRSQPGKDKSFAKKLEKGTAKIKGLTRLLLIEADTPLGHADLPDEAHPFNVPGAPGKDRMEIPKAEPWKSPFGEVLLYEYLRSRYLDKARAIANIDAYDLIVPHKAGSVFDRAVASSTGAILLAGQQIYPWRVRNEDTASFGDHICRQFDAKSLRKRWCVAPQKAGDKSVWRLIRVVGTEPNKAEVAGFLRCMALRHEGESVSKIVPKTSLIEDEGLLALMKAQFGADPVRMPQEDGLKIDKSARSTTIVTTMKNEGPFILEWLAYHRAIGVDNFLIYTNDCTDGTDTMLKMLETKGFCQHRENPFRESGLKPQHAALQAADDEPIITNADWAICMDVDEFITIHCGDGTLNALYDAVPDANMIALTWRLFGNADIHEFRDEFITEKFTRCAPEFARKPHQAWGFKTLFRHIGIFKKLGVHRPKGLKPQLWEEINWVNGSGKPLPENMYRNGWRSTTDTYGYDLVSLNHYAVRSAESFLVKRDRGRVNHVDRDQGLAYWFRMNNNAEENTSIHRMLPAAKAEFDKMMQDPEIAAAHAHSVACHRAKIDELRATDNYAAFYEELTGSRMEKLARLHTHFGANVFLSGPELIPDEIIEKDPDEDFFFTVEKGETIH